MVSNGATNFEKILFSPVLQLKFNGPIPPPTDAFRTIGVPGQIAVSGVKLKINGSTLGTETEKESVAVLPH